MGDLCMLMQIKVPPEATNISGCKIPMWNELINLSIAIAFIGQKLSLVSFWIGSHCTTYYVCMQLGKLTFCLKGGETDIYSSLTLTLDYCRGKRLVQLELKLFGININASGKVSARQRHSCTRMPHTQHRGNWNSNFEDLFFKARSFQESIYTKINFLRSILDWILFWLCSLHFLYIQSDCFKFRLYESGGNSRT